MAEPPGYGARNCSQWGQHKPAPREEPETNRQEYHSLAFNYFLKKATLANHQRSLPADSSPSTVYPQTGRCPKADPSWRLRAWHRDRCCPHPPPCLTPSLLTTQFVIFSYTKKLREEYQEHTAPAWGKPREPALLQQGPPGPCSQAQDILGCSLLPFLTEWGRAKSWGSRDRAGQSRVPPGHPGLTLAWLTSSSVRSCSWPAAALRMACMLSFSTLSCCRSHLRGSGVTPQLGPFLTPPQSPVLRGHPKCTAPCSHHPTPDWGSPSPGAPPYTSPRP